MFPRNEQNDLKSLCNKRQFTITRGKKSFGILSLNQSNCTIHCHVTPPSLHSTHAQRFWKYRIQRPCCDQTAGGWDDSKRLSTQTRPDQSFFIWCIEQSDESLWTVLGCGGIKLAISHIASLLPQSLIYKTWTTRERTLQFTWKGLKSI